MPNPSETDAEQELTFEFSLKFKTFGRPSDAQRQQIELQNMLDVQMTRDSHGMNSIVIVGAHGFITETPKQDQEQNAMKRYALTETPTSGA